MSAYWMYLAASLLFYVAGIIMIVNGNAPLGVVLVALGCTCFAIALNRRKRNK